MPVGAPVEPCGRQTADAAADHDKIIALVDRSAAERERLAVAQLVADLDRAFMLAAHAGQRGRIASGLRLPLRVQLRHGREPGRNGKGDAVEKITARDVGHGGSPRLATRD